MLPWPIGLVGRDFFVLFVFFENCYFYNKLVIGLRVIQFCPLSFHFAPRSWPILLFKIARNDWTPPSPKYYGIRNTMYAPVGARRLSASLGRLKLLGKNRLFFLKKKKIIKVSM